LRQRIFRRRRTAPSGSGRFWMNSQRSPRLQGRPQKLPGGREVNEPQWLTLRFFAAPVRSDSRLVEGAALLRRSRPAAPNLAPYSAACSAAGLPLSKIACPVVCRSLQILQSRAKALAQAMHAGGDVRRELPDALKHEARRQGVRTVGVGVVRLRKHASPQPLGFCRTTSVDAMSGPMATRSTAMPKRR
jgi:hypothetical protein